jgi:hypothetical protein
MRRLALTLWLAVTLAACVPGPAVPQATATPRPPGGAAKFLPQPPLPSPTGTDQLEGTAQGRPFTVPTEPSPSAPADFQVEFHPDGGLYVGDQVSLEVIVPAGFEPSGKNISAAADGTDIGTAPVSPFGIAGREEAVFTWAWDTSGLQPGTHRLDFSVLPDGPKWSETVSLLPASDLPPPGASAHWETLTTNCCEISYITGTDAARDIAALGEMADAQALDVEDKFNTTLTEKIPVVLMSRVLGHSGFTSDAIYVSYLDRNYAGSTTAQVLHHEMVHWYDGKLGGDLRPTILVEGLAVYLSGGHFKPESMPPRAAALLDLGWYIPLRKLSDNFYPSQHEIGYIEAGALVQYLVETYGWEAFNAFYRDIHPAPSKKQSDAMDVALQAHFDITYDQLETNWLESLRALPEQPTVREDVVQTVDFYNAVRRYQTAFDPSAYFQTAWLPDAAQMRKKGITADYVRHPDAPVNTYLETLLVQADASLRAGDYGLAGHLIAVVNDYLDVTQSLN